MRLSEINNKMYPSPFTPKRTRICPNIDGRIPTYLLQYSLCFESLNQKIKTKTS